RASSLLRKNLGQAANGIRRSGERFEHFVLSRISSGEKARERRQRPRSGRDAKRELQRAPRKAIEVRCPSCGIAARAERIRTNGIDREQEKIRARSRIRTGE